MHPYAIESMVQERRSELARLSQAGSGVRAARRARVPAWRRGSAKAIAVLAVAVGVPRSRRGAARRQVTAVLGCEPPS